MGNRDEPAPRKGWLAPNENANCQCYGSPDDRWSVGQAPACRLYNIQSFA